MVVDYLSMSSVNFAILYFCSLISEPPETIRIPPAPDASAIAHAGSPLFNTILDEEGLKKDREGQPRTAYSLRHTYICLRLTEGADIYQIAKNCRTSVEMIEKYYASHLKNSLDAAAINIRRRKAKKNEPPTEQEE